MIAVGIGIAGHRAALPVAALAVLAFCLVGVLLSAGATLGYDFFAYRAAGERVLAGASLYDPAATMAGPGGLFLYPPPFALAMVPFALVPGDVALWTWTALVVASLLLAIAVMPVDRATRWRVLLLAALDWPVLFAVKLGQVGPILLLLFALAWCSASAGSHPARVGVAAAVGTLVKLQPAVLFLVAALRREWGALVVGGVLLGLAVALSWAVLPASTWPDYTALLGRVSRPSATIGTVSPGAVAMTLGASTGVADLVQGGTMLLAGVVLVVATLRGSASVAVIVAAVASQLLSPMLWDHYAVVLLLPTAYLLANGVRLAALLPLATSLPLVVAGLVPPLVYPIVLVIGLVAPLLVARRQVRTEPGREAVLSSAS